jgi:VWFA-related protein
LLPVAKARAGDRPSDDEVAQAIARGVAFVKAQQDPKGTWAYTFNHNHALGITALAGLALMENGVDRADPVVAGASEAIRSLALQSNQTYDIALAILFLARVQPETRGPNDDLICRLAARLAGGEHGGMWDYTVPLDQGDDLPESVRKQERPKRRIRIRPQSNGDNSNTQFALLGIWAAGRHGFDANDALEAIDAHFRETQDRNGRWGYKPGMGGADAMTCAGLMGLAISAARPKVAERLSARARGAALAADPVFTEALKAVSKDARNIGPHSDIYYLWSVERVCVALGLRDLDGLDWYATGARDLLSLQREDGSWPDQRWGSLPQTCLALLFLRKANLAFELDRVLKLPGASRPSSPALALAEAPPDVPPDQPKSDDDARVIVTGASDSHFPEIGVEFEVKRPDGSFLRDATRKDIHVFEYDKEMTIEVFQAPTATEANPITVVLVVDRSLSMEEEDRIGSLKRAVASFAQGLPKGSRVAVVAFGSKVETICRFTSDPGKVVEAVNRLVPAGATRYYDAVAEALEMLKQETGRRAVLALTDGEDTFSQTDTLDSVVVTARRLGLPVHTLGLGSEDEIESDALRRLAAATRGQYYPARQADQLRTIYEQIAERLKSTYSLTYRTDRKLPDGTLRPVRVSYRQSKQVGETAVFIPGMVVPAPNWSPLFVFLVIVLSTMLLLPQVLARRGASRQSEG